MLDPTLESAAGDLAEVRDRLEAAREAMQRALDARGGEPDAVRRVVARPERIAAEVERVEQAVAGRIAGEVAA